MKLDVPFNVMLGIELDDHPHGVRLDCTPDHRNHLGTVHAAVIFAVAEAASARTLLETFPDHQDKVIAVLRSNTGKYRSPANEAIRAIGSVLTDDANDLVRRLDQRGRGEITVEVSACEGDTEVFVGSFRWYVSVVK
jgi:acyl-coenzyme A thioesterase PaaI-like protein